MTDRRLAHLGTRLLAVLFCLLSALPAMAAETNSLQLPATKSCPPGRPAKAADQHAVTETGSYVDHVTRQYSTEVPSLSVKMPGGRLSVGLTCEHGT
ncbi:MAG: hypothetical protein GY801_07880 [bacterium]|nr:hypothetical protein [bacterium]